MELDDMQAPADRWGSASGEAPVDAHVGGDADTSLLPSADAADAADAKTEELDSEQVVDNKLAQMSERQPERDVDAKRRKADAFAKLFGRPLEAVKIGRFTVVRKLGAGGMGVVYLAYDESLDRRVAVKLLRSARSKPVAEARFEREAQAMARLSHPNVITVHEVGAHEGQTFVAMEFVEGSDLRDWMAAGTHPWAEVVELFRQAGEGLAAAHEAGIVHRDFKPDNVLLGKDGRARVADFGLAHGFGELAEASASVSEDSGSNRLNIELTRPGAIMGTPAYMAPEQYAGLRSDARGDQFSFCVALWEALYGERPFKGKNASELSYAIRLGEVFEPSDERGVPAWLRAIVLRGLATDPAARWPSMRGLIDALGNDPSVRRRRALARLAVAAGALTLVAVAWLASNEIAYNQRQQYWNGVTDELLELERERGLEQARDDATRARDATRMSVARSYKLQTSRREQQDPTMAAALLREVEGEARESEEWISMANELLGQPLSAAVLSEHRGVIMTLRFGPKGRWLYSGDDTGEVWRWDMHDFEGERIVNLGAALSDMALDPGGTALAVSAESGAVQLWTAARQVSETVVHCEGVARTVRISAGGKLAVGCASGALLLFDLYTREVERLDASDKAIYALDFDPSGEWLLAAGADSKARIWRLGEATPRWTLEGHEQPIYFVRMLSESQALTAADDGQALSWRLGEAEPQARLVVRHDQAISGLDVYGDMLATGTIKGEVKLSSLSGTTESVQVAKHDEDVWSVAFTPDGQSLVTASFDDTAQLSSVSRRAAPLVFTGHRTSLFRAAVDPSGKWLATGSYDSDVRIWSLERAPLRRRLSGHTEGVFEVAVDHSGTRAVSASFDGTLRLWSLDDGALLSVLDQERGRSPLRYATFSPDGAQIAAGRYNGEVLLWTPARDDVRVLGRHEDQAWRVAFSDDGTLLASASNDGKIGLWPVEEHSMRAPSFLVGHGSRVLDVAFTPDGGRLVSASWDTTLRMWDVATGEQLIVRDDHDGRVVRVLRSPTGSIWASASEDGTARLWPASFEGEPHVLEGHTRGLWSLRFDESGERLVTVGHDGRALVWRCADGVLLANLDGHGNDVWDAVFLGDERVATAASDGALRVWWLDGERGPVVLPAHQKEVQSLALGLDGTRLVSVGADDMAYLWDLGQIQAHPAVLSEALAAVTTLCPSASQRELELGETPELARKGARACMVRR